MRNCPKIFNYWITKGISKKEKLAEIVFKPELDPAHLELTTITPEIKYGLQKYQSKEKRLKQVATDVAGMTYKHGGIL
jgi:hypothetical protein